MIKLSYGLRKQVSFPNFYEYYFALGFLANSNNAELKWENNDDQGAWGSEGRIHCLVPEIRFPQCFKFTAGRGNVYARINCNEYVATLVNVHNFQYNSSYQDVEEIIKTVPPEYKDSFRDGYNSKLNFSSAYKENSIHHQQSRQSLTKTKIMDSKKIMPKAQTTILVEIAIGNKVSHKKFGVGTVIKIDKNIIHVTFAEYGEKMFLNPNSFTEGFLTIMK
jgi:hypothetical protein